MIEGILIVGITIAGTAWYVRHKRRQRALHKSARGVTGLQVLERRYVYGEISREEYLQKRGDILGFPVGSSE
jgi:uncharacterized membrane protein